MSRPNPFCAMQPIPAVSATLNKLDEEGKLETLRELVMNRPKMRHDEFEKQVHDLIGREMSIFEMNAIVNVVSKFRS